MEEKYQVFISYRRDGGEYLARSIRDRLTEKGFKVFFDVESLRSGDFNTALLDKIEECEDFVLVLPPGSLDRCSNPKDWVRREVVHALYHKKNIVPILERGFVWPTSLPKDMQNLPRQNGISANSEFFDAAIDRLVNNFLHSIPQNGEATDKQLIAAAEAGNTEAMNELAMKYEHGSPTLNINRKEALRLYEKAVEADDEVAMYNLADVYEQCGRDLTLIVDYGIDTNESDPERAQAELRARAIEYYKKSAQGGFIPALYRLGNLAEEERDFKEAHKYYTAAGKEDYQPAKNALGFFMYNNLLGTLDIEAATLLFKELADAHYAPAIYNYAKAIQKKEIEETVKLLLSISFMPQAANDLGYIYEKTYHNLHTAITYYRMAYESGMTEAGQNLQRCQDKLFLKASPNRK